MSRKHKQPSSVPLGIAAQVPEAARVTILADQTKTIEYYEESPRLLRIKLNGRFYNYSRNPLCLSGKVNGRKSKGKTLSGRRVTNGSTHNGRVVKRVWDDDRKCMVLADSNVYGAGRVKDISDWQDLTQYWNRVNYFDNKQKAKDCFQYARNA
jgi:hypothetical protein